MIARTWHGITRSSEAEAYRNYVIKTGVKDLGSTKGNLGIQIWQQKDGDITHIWVVSWWNHYDSIKSFAGDDIEIARYYDLDKNYLLELEPRVQHYDSWAFQPATR